MSNTEVQNFEEMTQMLEEQGRKLRELEIRLQKERQEKESLEVDFNHLLDQLNTCANVMRINKNAVVSCG